jgi:hypothetical protein
VPTDSWLSIYQVMQSLVKRTLIARNTTSYGQKTFLPSCRQEHKRQRNRLTVGRRVLVLKRSHGFAMHQRAAMPAYQTRFVLHCASSVGTNTTRLGLLIALVPSFQVYYIRHAVSCPVTAAVSRPPKKNRSKLEDILD